MESTWVDRQIAVYRYRVAQSGALTDVPPTLASPDGALAHRSWRVGDTGIEVELLIFRSQTEHAVVLDAVTKSPWGDGYEVRSASSGAAVMFARVRPGSPGADRLSQLLSSFAGEE
jgi:hypothetical protein